VDEPVLPIVQGDWVYRPGGAFEVARVRQAYWDGGKVYADLVPYSLDGESIGRQSPIEGGPKAFEPFCLITDNGWIRIERPRFPLRPAVIGRSIGDGRRVMEMTVLYDGFGGAAEKPLRTKVRRQSRDRASPHAKDSRLRRALEKIADGHNDARALAQQALGRRTGER
jgi:hypothetical protein